MQISCSRVTLCGCVSRVCRSQPVGSWLLRRPGYLLIGPRKSREEIEFDVWIEISDGPWVMNLSLSMWVKATHHILGMQKGWIRCWQSAAVGCPRELHYGIMYTCHKSSWGVDRIGTRCGSGGVRLNLCSNLVSSHLLLYIGTKLSEWVHWSCVLEASVRLFCQIPDCILCSKWLQLEKFNENVQSSVPFFVGHDGSKVNATIYICTVDLCGQFC